MKNKLFKQLILAVIIIFIPAFVTAQISEPKVTKSVFFAVSKPIRDMKIILPGELTKGNMKGVENKIGELEMGSFEQNITHSVKSAKTQNYQGERKTRGPVLNFEGISNVQNFGPADPNGDVGLNHYIQTVNTSFAVWDKEENLLYGPVDNKSIWEGFPGPWDSTYWGGDPVFKYDHLADRWVVSAHYYNSPLNDFYEMVAVSTTPDPLGSYYCYAFQFDAISDYPKLAIWPDGYYLTYLMMTPFWGPYLNSKMTVVDRDAMLAGLPEITMVEFDIEIPQAYLYISPLSSDIEGFLLPDNSPNYVLMNVLEMYNNPMPVNLNLYEFSVDWDTPSESSFILINQFPVDTIPYWQGGVDQPGEIQNIESLIYRLMYPLSYRKFNDYEVLVACQTLFNDMKHYKKWYELRNEGSGWYVHQMGGYSPDDTERFMGSININGNGDIALGYSVADESTNPSIRITGRKQSDPLGEMTFEEIEVYKGLNHANNIVNNRNRWGDYSSMSVDPVDDSTFWYTSMYTTDSEGFGNWSTRIISFNLSGEPELPYVDAGNDTLTCNTLLFTTQGIAGNYSSILWTSSGDGNFIVNYSVNAKYLRGPGDINTGQVTLTMHLTGYEPGMEAADSMILYINKDPDVYAGPDTTISIYESITLQGEVAYSYDYFWSTLGDGVFSDITALNAIYTPGIADTTNREVILVLTANEVSPCTGYVSDSLTLTLDETTGVNALLSQELNVQIVPNPTSGLINIHVKTMKKTALTLNVLNSSGKQIFTGNLKTTNNQFDQQLDFSYLINGIYFIRIYGHSMQKTIKIIKKE